MKNLFTIFLCLICSLGVFGQNMLIKNGTVLTVTKGILT